MNTADFDPWAPDMEAQVAYIICEGGPQLAKLRAFVQQIAHQPAKFDDNAEAIARIVDRWKAEQTSLLDAALPAPGSPDEAAYVTAIEQGRQKIREGQFVTHEDLLATLDAILSDAKAR